MESNNYKPLPIPPRREIKQDNRQIKAKATFSFNTSFADVEITADININKTAPKPQRIVKVNDKESEIKMMFYKMRNIARSSFNKANEDPFSFYMQADFMKNFEDDFENVAQLDDYFPSYQKMSFDQLRTYYSWRTKVRKGIIDEVDISYAFIYVYEIINGIGIDNCDDGLEKLINLWSRFREFNDQTDKYLLHWIKDYFIYFPVKMQFNDFVNEHGLHTHYPSVYAYGSDPKYSFDLFLAISKYDITKSIFYIGENEKLIKGAFIFTLEELRKKFANTEGKFEDLLFFSLTKKALWKPFNRTLFYPVQNSRDRKVNISDKEVYVQRHGQWSYNTVILSESGRLIITYIMKEIEASLRTYTNYKYKLQTTPPSLDVKTQNQLTNAGVLFPRFIKECAYNYYKLSTRTVVQINTKALEKIRDEAAITQEKLIVEEESEIKALKPQNEQSVTVEVDIPIIEFEETQAQINENNEWANLRESLTDIQIQALKVIIKGDDINAFAREQKLMPEVIAEEINDKAVDIIGDTIMEFDGSVEIYEDYFDNIKEMLEQ